MTAHVLRGDARHLPLPDGCVDLIVTSPPYFGLRSYTDGGAHYPGQIGSEPTPAAWLNALLDCTAEWVRVLKPDGNLFVNLGDKYDAGTDSPRRVPGDLNWIRKASSPRGTTGCPKSLLGLPWRYAHGCMDQVGLILRAEIIWAKPNGLPESVTDRVRRAHEQVFHFTRQPRYYAAVDEIREPHAGTTHPQNPRPSVQSGNGTTHRTGGFDSATLNPLGKLPGSVWDIPSAPLQVPERLGVDHFAAFPPALVRPIVLGWSPPGVCTACGHGRRPVSAAEPAEARSWALAQRNGRTWHGDGADPKRALGIAAADRQRTITGYACACSGHQAVKVRPGLPRTCAHCKLNLRECADTDDHMCLGWVHVVNGLHHCEPPYWLAEPIGESSSQTRPAIVLDPFGGTGTTALVASCYGRVGVTVDLSADYCRLAQWRVNDPGERARARAMPKPPPVPDGMEPLFTM